jgi:hypothetical protein
MAEPQRACPNAMRDTPCNVSYSHGSRTYVQGWRCNDCPGPVVPLALVLRFIRDDGRHIIGRAKTPRDAALDLGDSLQRQFNLGRGNA